MAEFDLSDSGTALLHETARTLDRIDDLERAVTEQGVTVTGSTGQTVVHPAVGEARQQRAMLARLVAALDLDAEDDDDEKATPSVNSERASYAARSRWDNVRRLGGAG